MDWTDVGARVREARLARSLTQAQLAQRADLDRTAVARIESGDRRLDALELGPLSAALQVPLSHLVTLPPPALVSRRMTLGDRPDAAGRSTFALDVRLQEHHRDATVLMSMGHLVLPERPDLGGAGDQAQARALAGMVRDYLSVGDEPLGALAEVSERLALLVLVVDVDADGASMQDETFGVAVLGSRTPPGRRRATAAHEIGHHVLGDEYSSDVGISASRDEREQLIEAFASELLLPRAAVSRELAGRQRDGLRRALIGVAGRWRTSWSLAVATASIVLGLSAVDRQRLLASDPTRAEFIAVSGDSPEPDLQLGATGPAWRRAVLDAFAAGDLARDRAVELLYGLVTDDDLGERADLPDVW